MKIEITIFETKVNDDLALQYLTDPIQKCPDFVIGQQFILTEFKKPNNFCTWAWQDLFYVIHTLWNNGSFYPWYKQKNVVIASCIDGIRPVLFKIMRIE